MLKVPASVGEVLDKISILQIKSERLTDGRKLANVHKELAELLIAAEHHRFSDMEASLKTVNEALWDIEDRIRVKESWGSLTMSSSSLPVQSTSPTTGAPRSSDRSTTPADRL